MNLIRFQCPNCGGALTDPGEGTTLRCQYCSTLVMLPAEVVAARTAAAQDDAEWQVGEQAFAFWEDDGYFYPAEITAVNEDSLEVRYMDGNTAELDAEDLFELAVEVDSLLECQYDADGQYYDAVVTAVNGDQVQVEFEDGEQVWTDLQHLRFTETWGEDDRVFAYWEADEYYYAATITEIDGDDIHVRFDDGNTAVVTVEDLQDLDVQVDDEVESQFSGDGEFYSAVVTEVDGERVQVEYEDGASEWTTVSALRVVFE